MRKYFLFLMLVIASMVFVCKEYHEIPANAEIIGTEYVKYDKGLPVIELDSTKYAPTEIYTNNPIPKTDSTHTPILRQPLPICGLIQYLIFFLRPHPPL
jgi:hypothetical protein